MSLSKEKKKKKQVKEKTLIGKIANACVSFGLLSIILSGAVLGTNYYHNKIDQYRDLSGSISNSVVSMVRPEKVEEYIETMKQDEYFEVIHDYMNSTARNFDIKYFYVFVPRENDIMYIFDADYKDETSTYIGYTEPYLESSDKETFFKIMSGEIEEIVFYTTVDTQYGFLGCTYEPIKNRSGECIAIVGVEMDMSNILAEIMSFISKIIIATIIITIVVLSPFYLIVKRNVIEPVNKISAASKTMLDHISDNEEFHMDIHTGDEIEVLADSLEKMNSEIKQYIREISDYSSEREEMSAKLGIAASIQSRMLPVSFPEIPEIEIFAGIRPAKEVGGDFYDVFMIDDKRIAIVIGDVSGSGVPAATFMAIAKTLIWDRSFTENDLGGVFSFVNNTICRNNIEEMFVAAFEGVLDLTTGELTYVNAGHEPPFIMRKGEEFMIEKLEPSLALGTVENMPYEMRSIMLNPGDRLFHYTDGVTEAANWKSEIFELKRLQDSLNRHREEAPEMLFTSIVKDVNRFVGEEPQHDDMTMLCLEYKQKKEV